MAETLTFTLDTGDGEARDVVITLRPDLAPNHVGNGIGTLLLAHALKTLPSPVRLHTFQANHGARRFYERHGFTAIAFTDGQGNEERCPDVLYELASRG